MWYKLIKLSQKNGGDDVINIARISMMNMEGWENCTATMLLDIM